MINTLYKNLSDHIVGFYKFMTKEYFLKGVSLARIGIGLLIVYNYLILYHQRQVIYGPNGIVGSQYNSYTLYGLSDEAWYFELIYHAGIIFAILFTLGYKEKIVGIINFILTFSFIRQGFLVTDGGDNLTYLLLFYLLFARTNVFYSIDSKKRKENKLSTKIDLKNIIHNFAVLACIVQVCIMYFVSGLYQVQGDKWANGTAIYYILQTDVFSNPNLSDIVSNNVYLMVSLTYLSIIIKIAFPFMILNKKTKYLAVFSIIGFHLGIAVFMGLITFSLTMIIAELILFTDKEFESFEEFLKKLQFKLKKISNEPFLKRRES